MLHNVARCDQVQAQNQGIALRYSDSTNKKLLFAALVASAILLCSRFLFLNTTTRPVDADSRIVVPGYGIKTCYVGMPVEQLSNDWQPDRSDDSNARFRLYNTFEMSPRSSLHETPSIDVFYEVVSSSEWNVQSFSCQ